MSKPKKSAKKQMKQAVSNNLTRDHARLIAKLVEDASWEDVTYDVLYDIFEEDGAKAARAYAKKVDSLCAFVNKRLPADERIHISAEETAEDIIGCNSDEDEE